jgi:hypothetical protein
MSDILEQYREDIEEDLKIDQFNVKKVQMRAPARKHYWVARMINTKIRLNQLVAKKKKLKSDVIRQLIQKAPTKLSQNALSNAAEENSAIAALTEQIVELETLVEYLEHVVKIMSNIHWEIKNIIELMQMETE